VSASTVTDPQEDVIANPVVVVVVLEGLLTAESRYSSSTLPAVYACPKVIAKLLELITLLVYCTGDKKLQLLTAPEEYRKVSGFEIVMTPQAGREWGRENFK
jgi:hypothetical protein